MKTLVAFYSLDGNTKYLAEAVARQLQADLLEIRPKKPYPSRGFQKYLRGGMSVIFRECPKLADQNTDPGAYQNLIIGTPVWAGSYSAPIHSFLRQNRFRNKKIALFACHAGAEADAAEKCFARFRRELAGNTLVGETSFREPLKNNPEENAEKAVRWATSLPF